MHAQGIRGTARRHGTRNVRVIDSTACRWETDASDVDPLVSCNAARHGVPPLIGFAQDVNTIVGGDVDSPTTEFMLDEVTSSWIARFPARGRPSFAGCAQPHPKVVRTCLGMSFRPIPTRHSATSPRILSM